MAATVDRTDILRLWDVFHQPGEVLEVRVPKAGKYKTISGYFDNPTDFVKWVGGAAEDSTRQFPGYYFTVNPPRPDLLARACNRLKLYAETTTTDADITALHWLPIDLDAKRPAGISSTDVEHEAAIIKAREIRCWLIEQGWPASAFVLADSGNGSHLDVKIDLPNVPECVNLVKDCLTALDSKFSDDIVHVDTTTFNPSRIMKLYGTMARKGDSTPDRPHRLAKLLEVPETLDTVSRALLEALAKSAPTDSTHKNESSYDNSKFDVEKYVVSHGSAVKRMSKKGPWTAYELEVCPFDSSHDRGEAIISIHDNGAKAFKCHHDSCKGRDWHALRDLWEPSRRERTPQAGDLVFVDVFDEIGTDNDGDPIIKFNHSKTADSILQKLPVVLGEDDLLYYWQGDIWADKAEDILHNQIHRIAGKHYNRYTHKEVIAALRHLLAFSRVKFNPDPHLLGVGNGVVDLKTGRFRDYKKEDYISSRIPTRYDPLATCPRFIQFLEEACPNPVDRLMLIDWLTLHAFRKAFPYLMVLVGRGRNGKGVYEYVLIQFFGKESFSFMSLEEVANPKNNFAKASLLGKRGLIVSEAGDDTRRGKAVIPTKFLKLSTGDGTIDSDRKNTTRIQFSPEFKSTLDTNDMPSIRDTSVGWAERFCKVDMPYQFVDNPDPNNPREKKKDPHLKSKLAAPDELSGILNLLIERAKEISKTETIIKRSGADMAAEYAVQSGSVAAFLERYCEYVPYGSHGEAVEEGWRLDDVYKAYSSWCTHPQVNADLVDDKRFGGAVSRFCPGAKTKKERNVKGQQSKQYFGFMFFKDQFDKDMESIAAPVCSINVPLESVSTPLAPLFSSIWEDIKKRYGNITITSSPLLLEKFPQKRPFIGAVGAQHDFEGANEEVNGTPLEPMAVLDGAITGDSEKAKSDSINANLQQADEQAKAKEEHFRTPGKPTCYKAKIRTYAITEYGINGWVDPLKLSSVVGLPVCLVCHGLDHLKYRRYERQGGGIGYTQKAAEAKT